MRKTYCDACGIECHDGGRAFGGVVEFPCHIIEGQRSYTDCEGNAVSGRKVAKDLCAKCYNLAWSAARAAITENKHA